MNLYSFSISKASDAAQAVVSTECSSDYLDVSIRKKSMDVLSLSPFQFRFRISTPVSYTHLTLPTKRIV